MQIKVAKAAFLAGLDFKPCDCQGITWFSDLAN